MVNQVWKTVTLLEGLGLTENQEKSLIWVGVVCNAQLGTWEPQQRLLNRVQDLDSLLSHQKEGSRKQWETLLGLIVFAAQLNRITKLRVEARILRPRSDRDLPVRFHLRLLEGLEPWTTLDAL